jgi:Cd2+/Zn2+-exporting ATPase
MSIAYHIRGLDCAACGAKIEKAVNDLPGVSHAVVDFANLRLHLDAADPERVRSEIKRIDPTVDILPAEDAAGKTTGPQETFRIKREIGIIIAAFIIFVVHAIFEDRFHAADLLLLDYGIALTAYFLAGINIYINAFKTLRRGDFFDENVLMVIATAGAIAIHSLSEAIGVMLFFKTGEFLQNLAVARSRRSIHALLASKPDTANVESADGLRPVPPERVRVGETILVKPGEKVPLDGEVVTGQSSLDASPLTGESTPLNARSGDGLLAGMINLTGALKLKVTKPFNESSIAKVLELVENASARKAATEKFITRFARWYTPAVVAVAAGIAVLPPLVMDQDFRTWIYRALVVLVISCPCALVISIPLGYFGGVGRASRQGILVKGSNFLDALAKVKTVVFDKTGTLTRGEFQVQKIVALNGHGERQLLELAALAELHSSHPIARSIVAKCTEMGIPLDNARIEEHSEMPGRGVRARVGGREILVGSDGLLHHRQIAHEVCALDGTAAHIVIDGAYAGHVLIGDSLKEDAAQAVSRLRDIGVERIEMLTGDNRCTAQSVAEALKVDGFHAELLPEDKVRLLEEIQSAARNGAKVAFVGDGINDAPVIARADVGVAMGALGTDAAIETADVVLMTDSPQKMAEAVRIARRTRTIVWQNIVMALSIKAVFVALGTIGLASMWEAVFADMGVALAAIVNATRVLRGKERSETNSP